MKKPLKLTALILAMIMTLSALAACANTETETKTETGSSAELYFTNQDCVDPPYERGAFMAFGADYHISGSAVSPTLSTFPNTNGAIALFYPGVQQKLAEVMKPLPKKSKQLM